SWFNNHIGTSRTWHSTLDQQQIVFCIHAYNFQRLGSHLFCTHVSCHLLALPYAARSLALTDRTRSTMGQGVTVGHILSTEIPALNPGLVALTLGRTSDVYLLSCVNFRTVQLITNAESFLSAARLNATSGFWFRLRKVASISFCQPGSLLLAVYSL